MAPTGPTSPEGKAVSARNSTRHGLRARAIVLPGESQVDWDDFERAYLEDLAPVGIGEEVLARPAAELQWRLRRVAAAERDAMDECAEDPGAFKSTAAYRKSFGYKTPNVFPDRLPESLPAVSALNPLMRYEAHLSRQYQAAMRDLLAMQDRRRGNARITRVEIHGFPGNAAEPRQRLDAADLSGSQPPPAVDALEDAKLPNELHSGGSGEYPRSPGSSESPDEDDAAAAEQLSSLDENTQENASPEADHEKLPNELSPRTTANESPGEILIDTVDRLRAYSHAVTADPSIKDDPTSSSPRDIVVDAFARLEKHMPPGWLPPREIARFIAAERLTPSIDDVFRADEEDEEEEDDPLRAATLPASLGGG